MSYRSRLYNHRNAQSPETGKKKPFFAKQHGASDDKGKFFQKKPAANAPDDKQEKEPHGMAASFVQRLATSAEDEKLSTNDARMERDKEDKVKAVHGAGLAPPGIQRDLAIEPANPDVAEPELTAGQIRTAIIFNRDRYSTQSIRLIQNIVGGPITGIMDEQTVRLIALYQAQNNLTPDGMAGPDTFGQLTSELTAEGAPDDTCLTMFNVAVTSPMELHAAGPNLANIFGHFEVSIQFSPHCDCSQFEYRQFIGGQVTLNGTVINANFSVPGGGLPGLGNFVQDGNTTLPNNGRYGHRKLPANQGLVNQYTDPDGTVNMANGCVFNSLDEPGVVGAPANPGDVYVFDIRFFGDILRNGKPIPSE